MINGTIYVITNLNNNKKYVGLTGRSAEERFEEHINNALKGMNMILYKAIRKHGRQNFKVEVLETRIDNADDLKEREKYWIKELKTYTFTSGHGYNMTLGGDGALGYKWTEEQCRTGEKNPMYGRSGEKNPMYGRSGEKNPRAKAIILIFPNGSKKEFGTIKEASLYLGGVARNCYIAKGIQSLLKSWKPKRGRWVGYSAMYLEDIEQETT